MIQTALLIAAALTLGAGTEDDCTAEFLRLVRGTSAAGGGTVELKKGTYRFRHGSATPIEVYVSNHDQPMPRKVQLPFEGITNVTVNGNGSLFLFHGETSAFLLRNSWGKPPFLFRDCENMRTE